MELSGIELRYLISEINSKITSEYYVSSIVAVTRDSFLFPDASFYRAGYYVNVICSRHMAYKVQVQPGRGE